MTQFKTEVEDNDNFSPDKEVYIGGEGISNVESPGAMRHNEGKAQYSLIDLTKLEPCARVLEFGAKKYSRDNWKKGMNQDKIIDSLLRHIAAIQSGEDIDQESGLSHIGHIQANSLFLGNKDNTK